MEVQNGARKCSFWWRIASAITVHGGSHMRRRGLSAAAASGTEAPPATACYAGRSRCVVRKCQGHDARTRRQPRLTARCLLVLTITPRRRASHRRATGWEFNATNRSIELEGNPSCPWGMQRGAENTPCQGAVWGTNPAGICNTDDTLSCCTAAIHGFENIFRRVGARHFAALYERLSPRG
jgi:hypothetical protein